VLKPEFLGRVNLHASLVENSLMATIAAESPEVKQLLESQLSSLQTALREQGLPVVKVEVVQGNQLSFSEFGHGQGNSQNQETRQTQGLPPRDLPQNSHMQGETPVEAPSPLTSTPSRLLHLVA
jgi:flagellar hook-length control protein FliK